MTLLVTGKMAGHSGFRPQMVTWFPTTVVSFLIVPFLKVGGGAEQLVSASSAVAETLDLWCPQWGQLEASRPCAWAA